MKLKSIMLTVSITIILTILLVFTTGYFLFGLNKKPAGTFSSSGKNITIEKTLFINPDTLEFKTNIMSDPEKICVADISSYH